MRLITYASGPNGMPRLGVRVGHRVLDVEAASRVDGEPLPATMKGLLREGRGAMSRVQALAKAAQSSAGRYSLAMLEEKAIRFLPPVPDPDRFPCVGRNHRAHDDTLTREDLANEAPDMVTGLVGHNAKLVRPAAVARLDCEPELVFVIGRRALGVTEDDDEMDYIAGVTLMSDFTDRDSRRREAAAIGPELVTLDEIADPYDLWMTCTVNGEERIRVHTGEQVWKMSEILEHFSRGEALEQGDMFATGGQGGMAGKPGSDSLFLKPGDVVECAIEGITTLRTTISAP